MSTAGHYPPEGSDAPWEVLQMVLPKPTWRPGGPGRKPLALRRVIHGMFSVNTTGCPWRMLPTDLGKAPTIDGSCRRWRLAGGWARGMDTRRQWARRSQGRLPEPSACWVDSQRIKTATQGVAVGFAGHKTINGRKRHSLVETLGLIVAVVGTAANLDERQGVVLLLQHDFASGVTRLRQSWVDGGYQAQWLCDWVRSLKPTYTIALEVVEHAGKGFQVVNHRWQVERPFAWLGHDRRHRRDSERLTVRSEAMMHMSMIRLLLKRLA